MTTKRILLFGGSGQIGQALRAEALPGDWTLDAPTRAECDVTDHDKVREALQSFKPDLVINSAAMTSVDKCAADEDAALAVNFDAPANIALHCAAHDVPLIHLSTDYVFDGADGEIAYQPDDQMNPLSAYGQSKMMGEEAVRHELPWHVILRVSAVFSAFGSNILTRALDMIETQDEVAAATAQKSCPTYAPEIAKALIAITNAVLDGKTDGFGTFHFCGDGIANRLEFTQSVMELYAPFTAKRPNIIAAPAADVADAAKRPAWSVLDCAKIGNVYGIKQKPWREGLREAVPAIVAISSGNMHKKPT